MVIVCISHRPVWQTPNYIKTFCNFTISFLYEAYYSLDSPLPKWHAVNSDFTLISIDKIIFSLYCDRLRINFNETPLQIEDVSLVDAGIKRRRLTLPFLNVTSLRRAVVVKVFNWNTMCTWFLQNNGWHLVERTSNCNLHVIHLWH